MASKMANYWLRSVRRMATSAAPPAWNPGGKIKLRGEFVPVYATLGLIVASLSLGAYTATTQLSYNPNVRVSKKRREMLPEVEEPERVVDESTRFIKHSAFRKVAKMQDFNAVRAGISDPIRPTNALQNSTRLETLKSVGVETRPHAT